MALLTGPLPMVPAAGKAGPGSTEPRIVALGGGHGLAASLSALRLLTTELTAVVTVADDGGSSGRLRTELGVLPPGDLRMALSALCDDTDWGRTWRDVMQHRFKSRNGGQGSLDNHALGNLLIVTLWELLGDTVAGLQWAGALLGARGQVLPMASVPLTIEGQVRGLSADGTENTRTIHGQASLAVAGPVENVRLLPLDAPACEEALTAIELADWIVLGPGSWYTSVLPHLLLPELRQALCGTAAKRCLTMNLDVNDKETTGMSAADHLRVIARYAPEFGVDVVLADPGSILDRQDFARAASMIGAEVVLAKVAGSSGRAEHDPLRLAAAYHDIFGTG
ncbi:uridine diphosphate-N-acetylglucosamine-binding protein YvcK [Paenarthrobacter sp. Z7-10]|uniref:gluconeogenesis factor YvcK family protein n=1 Tax=Paenarthrobacter sp. Z7-10 TaxID=2787635 RepID=UPI0022A97F15|nr:uridine diphosphate-N-acetylglucosamine-binding protein YvcK [Paenarthrobacter sp. Z7-10]MCZ2402677.1 uridine diphosphate-N-acetylglucosamine-binding protein YvcK [Paenarthrobacter sp. Z7-10]